MGARTARLILVSQTRFRNAFADYSGATFLRLTKGSSADAIANADGGAYARARQPHPSLSEQRLHGS